MVSGAEQIQAGVLEALKVEQRALTLEYLAAVTGYETPELYSALNALMKDGRVQETIVHQHRRRGRRFGRPSRVTAWCLAGA